MTNMSRGFLLLFIFLLSTTGAEEYTARVVTVHDADTIVVLLQGKPKTIRLNGIDCPEVGQTKGSRAKKIVTETIAGKNVVLKTHGEDKHGRILADVLLNDGTSLNQQLVRSGNCRWGRSRLR